MPNPKLFAALFCAVMAFQSIRSLWVGLYYRFRGKLTTGHVLDVEAFEDSSGDGTTIRYRVRVQFHTESNDDVINTVIKNEDYYHRGLPVYVLYDPKLPSKFLVNSPKGDEEIVMGVIWLVISIGLALAAILIENTENQ